MAAYFLGVSLNWPALPGPLFQRQREARAEEAAANERRREQQRAEDRQVLFVAKNLKKCKLVDSSLNDRNIPIGSLLFGCVVELTRPPRAPFPAPARSAG